MNARTQIATPAPERPPIWQTGKRREFTQSGVVPARWPRSLEAANELVDYWLDSAREALASLRLSRDTVETIASHLSRKDGTCRMTDRAISARSTRSLPSTERDIRRLKQLGYLMVEFVPVAGRKRPERALKIAFPEPQSAHPRTPLANTPDCPSTYPPYVDGLDMGERRDV